jgi:hypothetical protein
LVFSGVATKVAPRAAALRTSASAAAQLAAASEVDVSWTTAASQVSKVGA